MLVCAILVVLILRRALEVGQVADGVVAVVLQAVTAIARGAAGLRRAQPVQRIVGEGLRLAAGGVGGGPL
ncbi:hypothetical protein [Candidatus Amarolinea dominans]|uniref:hypothetical protein n=1 Tax=Candidatus Amarolinea dominans TaxID=3140696 RepID=UPI00313486A3|nr:hypothetical protein [Anaerolineae bacterium]